MPFSPETVDFLVENRLQNSREWFKENKKRYEAAVLGPFVELVNRLSPGMLEIDPQFITEPKVDRTLSRVYRDTRFSRDKSLYRDNMWLVFMREKKLYNGLPAYYFDLGPGGFSCGMGYYQASPESMNAIRQLILGGEPSFQRAEEAFSGQDVFSLEGELYKKTKHPDAPGRLKTWLDRKGLSFNRHSADYELLYSGNLADTLLEGFRLLAPVYDFMCAAEARMIK